MRTANRCVTSIVWSWTRRCSTLARRNPAPRNSWESATPRSGRNSESRQRVPSHERIDFPQSPLRSREGRLPVIAKPFHFPDVVDAAFHQIRQNARNSAAVSIRLLEALAEIARFVRRPDDGLALRRHALMVFQAAEKSLPEHEDRRTIEQRHAKVLQRLGE